MLYRTSRAEWRTTRSSETLQFIQVPCFRFRHLRSAVHCTAIIIRNCGFGAATGAHPINNGLRVSGRQSCIYSTTAESYVKGFPCAAVNPPRVTSGKLNSLAPPCWSIIRWANYVGVELRVDLRREVCRSPVRSRHLPMNVGIRAYVDGRTSEVVSSCCRPPPGDHSA